MLQSLGHPAQVPADTPHCETAAHMQFLVFLPNHIKELTGHGPCLKIIRIKLV